MGDLVDKAQERELEIREDALATHAALNARPRESRIFCAECGDRIPLARREAVPGCKRCVHCEEDFELRMGTR